MPEPDHSLPRALLTPEHLEGEPDTDRAFRADDGKLYRVRVKEVEQPTSESGEPVVSFIRAVDVTVTLLDDKKAVVRNDAGDVELVANTRLTVDGDTVNNPDGLNLAETIDMIVGNMVHRATKVASVPEELSSALSGWRAAGKAVKPTAGGATSANNQGAPK